MFPSHDRLVITEYFLNDEGLTQYGPDIKKPDSLLDVFNGDKCPTFKCRNDVQETARENGFDYFMFNGIMYYFDNEYNSLHTIDID